MKPVFAIHGHAYERTAMKHWMQHTTASSVAGDLSHHRHVHGCSTESLRVQTTESQQGKLRAELLQSFRVVLHLKPENKCGLEL